MVHPVQMVGGRGWADVGPAQLVELVELAELVERVFQRSTDCHLHPKKHNYIVK